MKVTQLKSIGQIEAKTWNSLTGTEYPFLRHEFLLALEQNGAASEKTGWKPAHLLVMSGDTLLAAMPLYLKRHSWGEYVFDQQWAQAYLQQGLDYYPKALTAIPFTPCQGRRIAINAMADAVEVSRLLLQYIQQSSELQGISSWHCLFPEAPQVAIFQTLGLSIREGVQFQWFNPGYHGFDDFLQTCSASKRKMIKRERRKVAELGISLVQIEGRDISDEQWQVFYEFYAMTYFKRNSQPYLNLAFFKQIAATMGEQLLLVLAIKDNTSIAAALSFVGNDTLYGRFWGCYEDYPNLHFETCYYQGLDYCIARGLKRFDSGAQGEHKIARGFQPITTYSAHWIKDARFARAVGHFLQREQQAVQAYKQDAAKYLPFKQTS